MRHFTAPKINEIQSMQQHISGTGIKLIQHYEGLKLEAYKDAKGIDTIGYGNTFYEDGKPVKIGDVITKERAIELFASIVTKFEDMVRSKLKRPVTQNEFDALVSFAYNAGTSYKSGNAWRPYALWDNVNNNMPCDKMLAYWQSLAITSGGVKLNGLVKRRRSESELYCKDILNLY